MGQLIIDVLEVLIAIACVVGLYYFVVWALSFLQIAVPTMVLRVVFFVITCVVLIWIVSIFIGSSDVAPSEVILRRPFTAVRSSAMCAFLMLVDPAVMVASVKVGFVCPTAS